MVRHSAIYKHEMTCFIRTTTIHSSASHHGTFATLQLVWHQTLAQLVTLSSLSSYPFDMMQMYEQH